MKEYFNRIEMIIDHIRADLTVVPDGPERRLMEENLAQMMSIARKYLGDPDDNE